MATQKKTKKQTKPKPLTAADFDLDAKAWAKFERTIKNAAKMGPQPHKTAKSRGK